MTCDRMVAGSNHVVVKPLYKCASNYLNGKEAQGHTDLCDKAWHAK